MVAVWMAFAAYAVLLAVFAHGAEAVWGEWAVGGYGVAALAAGLGWQRRPGVSLAAALVGSFVVPAALLPPNWGATSEVRVVERAASLWLAHGSPYLASGHLESWKSYDPYLPGMSLFGLPHALGVPGALGDPLVWMAAATGLLLLAAFRMASRGPWGSSDRGRRALLRAVLLLACPVFAFPMALGVTDPLVIALMCLGLAAAMGRSPVAPGGGAVRDVDGGGVDAGRGAVRDVDAGGVVLAGLAIGVACALKATAWPALPVVLALVAVRDGRRSAARFAVAALGAAVAVVVVTAPGLLAHPRALWENIVAYPLGLSRRQTTAASPLPGHILASAGGFGHLAAIALLAGAALAVAVSLVRWPLRDVRQAAIRLAVGLTAMVLLAPDARFGYFAYPLGIVLWLAMAGVRRSPGAARQPGVAPAAQRRGPSPIARTALPIWRLSSR